MFARIVQLVRFARAYLTLVRQPRDLDSVFGMIDSTNDDEVLELLSRNAQVRVVMDAPPMPPLPDRATLLALPEGTVGRAYGELLLADGLDPEPLDYQRVDGPLHRFRRHMRASHDLWHVATGLGTDVHGELALQAFYLHQWDNPLSPALMSAGFLHAAIYQRGRAKPYLDAIAAGARLGAQADSLIGLDWHAWLDRPLDDLRHQLRLAPVAA